VIARIRLPRPLDRLRRRHDPLAASGVPGHVTLLVPFVAGERLTPSVRRSLAKIADSIAPFEARFEGVGRFPGVVWLAPRPAAPFRDLTARIVGAFPDHPPYEGRHDRVIPHLTIGLGDELELDLLEREVAALPPFAATIKAIEVISEDDANRWRLTWRMPLGGDRARP
jgi:2'-5' RNA ligase